MRAKMVKIDVVWLSYKKDTPPKYYWDMALLEDFFSNNLWSTGFEFEHHTDFNNLINNGAVVVFPARAQYDLVDKLNEDLAKLDWCLLLVTGDEEALLPVDQISYPNIKIWVMSPRPIIHQQYGKLPNGYPPQVKLIKDLKSSKKKDYFFAGQVTHIRRQECVKKLKEIPNGDLVETEGFTQGIPHKEYYQRMINAKICPCPSGPQIPDTFRLYESLEAGCIPIADEITPINDFKGYFTTLFEEEPPFPTIRDYESLPDYIKKILPDWLNLTNKCFAWWQKYKRKFVLKLVENIVELSKIEPTLKDITVLIPTNPIPSHPDTGVLDETIDSIRFHLPDCEIIITFDGVRNNLKKRTNAYQEYINRVLWKCNWQWSNVLPLIFEKHEHQANMAKEALKYVQTPLILYVEHDAPLVKDFIDWSNLIKIIRKGEANVIRFLHESHILSEYDHLMFDKEDQIIEKVPMRRTMQWSQRPHLSSKVFYQNMLEKYFHGEPTMIEDVVHGKLDEACQQGLMGWYDWRVWIYCPKGKGTLQRSYHLDGRKNDPKY